ncbi:response regulator [Paenibacillus macerans]|uniref:response regulator n=1 Tax=Paenibacillus macerans TaxID=44252 RepID=UPI002041C973|nr:response regulator [Paenibacillus macerans]MCM3698573.1 response regulator [Paenibacillus macerans]
MIRVLIVEDDPMVAKFNQSYLELVEGFRCVGTAESAEAAKRLLERVKPQLILLELYMRRQDGFALLNYIRSRAQNIDVIVISAARDPESIIKTRQYGAIDYLIKPYHFSRFKTSLELYRDTYRAMNSCRVMSQNDVDRLIWRGDCQAASRPLPKGLTSGTLQMVWEAIARQDNSGFSTNELSRTVGISRVSVRKYLDFLAGIGVLETEIIYGTGGRPLDKFWTVPEKSSMVSLYF